jgi:hypothetical protein
MLPLSVAMDDGEFDHGGDGGGSGGGGCPVAAVVAGVAARDNRDRWGWHLMAVVALDGGHATTSRRSKQG